LGFVNRQYLFDRLQLNDNLIVNNEIHLIATIKMYALVTDRKGNFAAESYPADRQFAT